MIRVHVICEGQTEEEFVRKIVAPALIDDQISLLPSCIGKVGRKGGNVNLNRLSVDVKGRLRGDRNSYCTTLFDYYGLPAGFPGKPEGATLNDISDKQAKVVQALSAWAEETIGQEPATRFIPYVQMYEFEGLLFSAPPVLAAAVGYSSIEEELQRIKSDFATPEWINDSANTAPSKRIEKLFPAYDKPEHPILAAIDIGLDNIRQECPLFDGWIKRLEGLNTGTGQ